MPHTQAGTELGSLCSRLLRACRRRRRGATGDAARRARPRDRAHPDDRRAGADGAEPRAAARDADDACSASPVCCSSRSESSALRPRRFEPRGPKIGVRQAIGAMPFQAARAPLGILSRAVALGMAVRTVCRAARAVRSRKGLGVAVGRHGLAARRRRGLSVFTAAATSPPVRLSGAHPAARRQNCCAKAEHIRRSVRCLRSARFVSDCVVATSPVVRVHVYAACDIAAFRSLAAARSIVDAV